MPTDIPTVVIYIDNDGYPTAHSYGNPVRVIWIDETAPDDRVYEIAARDDFAELTELIGDSEIGRATDGKLSENKLQAVHARIARLRGERPKKV